MTLDSLGCYNGDCSNVIIINKPTVDNKEINYLDNTQLYPNPTNGIINFINQQYDQSSYLRIYNTTGQVVMESNLHTGIPLLQIHIDDYLPNGIYFIHQFIKGKSIFNSKFILER